MGFDFHLRQPPMTLPRGYRPLEADDPGYFHLDAAAMAAIARVMDRAGLLDDGVAVAWPRLPADPRAAEVVAIVDAERAGGEGDPTAPPPTAAERAVAVAYLDAVDATRAVRSGRGGAVPAIKFRSPAGWIVDADEAGAIARGLRAAEVDHDAALAQWIWFNELGAAGSGYLVE
jgi:hypothetical protein